MADAGSIPAPVDVLPEWQAGAVADAAGLTAWANERLGKMQRLASVKIAVSLPRNDAGKVLKRELRED